PLLCRQEKRQWNPHQLLLQSLADVLRLFLPPLHFVHDLLHEPCPASPLLRRGPFHPGHCPLPLYPHHYSSPLLSRWQAVLLCAAVSLFGQQVASPHRERPEAGSGMMLPLEREQRAARFPKTNVFTNEKLVNADENV